MAQLGFQFESAEDQRILLAPGVRLAFRWTRDRWTHALEIQQRPTPGWLPVARAVEDDATPEKSAFVMSPAYQEIEPHAFEPGVRALLTGQSGPHHFSAVVTTRVNSRSILCEFDIADRCRSPVQALACTYEMDLDVGDLLDAGPRRIVWGSGICAGTLELLAEMPAQLALDASRPRAYRVQAIAQIDPKSFTHRCLYQWRWTPADGQSLKL
jgi:hypothetical protein